MEKQLLGLNDQEVLARTAKGEVNIQPKIYIKSDFEIIAYHTFNLFNAYNAVIGVFLILVQEYISAFFLLVVVMNIVIRSYQEIRAKRMVEKLNILICDKSCVVRNGTEILIDHETIVKDDIIRYRLGDQISTDAEIVSGHVEMNESLLTGEADAVFKTEGDVLLSGSFVSSGQCYGRVIRVGGDNYATKLMSEAKTYKPATSELMETFNRITELCVKLVLPVGVILIFQALYLRGNTFREMVVSTSTVLVGLLPKGLVLLTSLSFGVSVYRLGKKRTLVQDVYSVETLSRADALLIDKTGTLTEGKMRVSDVCYVADASCRSWLRSYLHYSQDKDMTTMAVRDYFGAEPQHERVYTAAFSSQRKWGAMAFADAGTFYLGAPEFLVPSIELPESVAQAQKEGDRVLLFAKSPAIIQTTVLEADLEVLAFIMIHDELRHDVQETLSFFAENEVDVKVISGDHINTLAAIAQQAGIPNAHHVIDASLIDSDEDLADAILNHNVVGRASPYQKQKMVSILQENGQKVAMVGDGVNDVLALRRADCSIAMGSGSQAARQISQVILLDNQFSTMIDVVMEGRLVTNNISRSASMYYLGTMLTFLLAIVSIITNVPFPFVPIQTSIMSMFVEGMPSTLVTFESNYHKMKIPILKQIARYVFPVALAMAIMFCIVLALPYSQAEQFSLLYYTVTFLSYVLVYRLFQPMDWKRFSVLVISALGFSSVCFLFGKLLRLMPFNQTHWFVLIGLCAVSLMLTVLLDKGVYRFLFPKNKSVIQ